MAKHRFKFILILLALLLLLTCLYIYFDRFAPVTMAEKTRIEVWYVSEDAAWQSLDDIVRDYNEGEGKEVGVTVSLKAFSNEAALNSALKSDDLPDIVFCNADTAATLGKDDKLARIDDYFDAWRLSEISSEYIDAATVKNKLVGIPFAAETDIMIVNTDLFSDTDSINTYEQLCAVSEEYYKRNDKSFYTVEDYSDFFRLMVLSLGGEFDGISPHDSKDEDCIHIYNDLLALSALNRGFDTPKDSPAKSVIEGEIPCAIVSSASVSAYLSDADGDIEFFPVPYMKDGEKAAVLRLTLLSICASNEEQELAACLFAEWLISSDEGSGIGKTCGSISVSGDDPTTSGKLEKKLCDAVDKAISSGETVIFPPDAEFAENSKEFDLNLATLMDGLRNK